MTDSSTAPGGATDTRAIRFGPFRLDLLDERLWRGDEHIPLAPKAFALLAHLAKRPAQLATKEALLDAVWSDAYVSDAVLKVAVGELRRALGDNARTPDYIQTVHGRGYRFIGEIEGQPSQPESADMPARPEPELQPDQRPASERVGALTPPAERPAFFGRAVELEQGRRALARAMAGQTQILLVVGEPGIGKTRFVEELSDEAGAQGGRVIWARSHEEQGQPAFWPWTRVLQRLTETPEDVALLRAALGSASNELLPLVPELAAELGRELGSIEMPPEAARYRFFDSVTSLLATQARDRPLVLVFDDLQWADASSLELLAFIAREIPAVPILLAATYRDLELHPNRDLERLLPSLIRAPHPCVSLALTGLERDDIAGLVESEDASRPDDFVDAVFERTGGNPFFAQEIVRLAALEMEDPSATSIPPGVQQVLQRRIAALDGACRDVLLTAAAIGRDFRLNLLAAATGQSASELLAILETAERARVIEPLEGAGSTFQFSHPLVREALYAELKLADRVEQHASIAAALRALHGDEPGPFLAHIAHHLIEALPVSVPGLVLEFALAAADYESRLLGFESAVDTLERAVRVLDDSGVIEDQRCDVLCRLAKARTRTGLRDAAAEDWRGVLTHARGSGDPDAFARGAVGLAAAIAFTAHTSTDVLDVLREALQGLGDDAPGLRALVLSALAWQLTWTPEWQQQDEISHAAAELARSSNDRETLITVLSQRAALLELHGSDDIRRQTYEEIESLALADGDREGLARAHTLRIKHDIESADAVRIDSHLEDLEKLATELRLPAYRLGCARVRVMRACWRGELVAAERLLQEALALGQRSDSEHAALVWSGQLGGLRRIQGRLPELEAPLRDASKRNSMLVSYDCFLAWICNETDRNDEAQQIFGDLSGRDFARVRPGDPHYWIILALLAELCPALGEVSEARWLYEALRPRAGRYLTIPHVMTVGCASRYLGTLSAMRGDTEGALTHLGEAISVERRMGARAWLAPALADQARVLLDRGEAGDRDAARQAAAEASGLADECGLGDTTRILEQLAPRLR